MLYFELALPLSSWTNLLALQTEESFPAAGKQRNIESEPFDLFRKILGNEFIKTFFLKHQIGKNKKKIKQKGNEKIKYRFLFDPQSCCIGTSNGFHSGYKLRGTTSVR